MTRLPSVTLRGLAAGAAIITGAVLLSSTPVRAIAPGVLYFPLEEDTRWAYAADRFDSTVEARVARVDEDSALYALHGFEYVVRPNAAGGLDVELEGEGFVPWYRFEDEAWTRRDIDFCNDGRDVFVVSRNSVIETRAGLFTDVIEISYGAPICGDAGRVREWWAPDVGLVQWQELSILGLITWTLESYGSPSESPLFRRGDADDSGRVDLSDAVRILGWLFLSSPAPVCPPAADSDANGSHDLSDAVYLLQWLFQGGDAPPFPGPMDCGAAGPDDDTSGCQSTSC